MENRMIERLMKRLRHKEEKALGELVLKKDAEFRALEEKEPTIEDVIAERGSKLKQHLIKNRRQYGVHRKYGSMEWEDLMNTTRKEELQASVLRSVISNPKRDLTFHRRRKTLERYSHPKLRSPLVLKETPVHQVEHTFISGWVFELDDLVIPPVRNYLPIHSYDDSTLFAHSELFIYHATQETHSGLLEQELKYRVDVDGRLYEPGHVTSYTDGKRDDKMRTLGKGAQEHVLGLINGALEELNPSPDRGWW
jgi:hypothetical protein